MAGLKLLTNLDPALCLKLAWRTAQDGGYSVPAIDDAAKRFTATKGSAMLSVLAGTLSPYCRFEIAVESYPDATELMLTKNRAWISGGLSAGKAIEANAAALMDAIAAAIAKAGGAISQRKEF